MSSSDLAALRRVVTRGVLLVALILGVNVFVLSYYALMPQARHSYDAMYHKVDMLDTIPAPRIIVIGGSSVAFGQNSKVMEELCGIPVINLGTHAGIGLHFMMQQAREKIRTGDIVLLAPEYAQFNGTFDGWHPLLDHVIENPEAMQYIRSWGQLEAILEAVPLKFKDPLDKRLRNFVAPGDIPAKEQTGWTINRVDTISDAPGYHGDTWSRERVRRSHPLRDWDPITGAYMDQQAITHVQEFRDACASMGVRVLIEYPPVPEKYFEQSRRWIDSLHSVLTAALPGAVLRHPRESTYPEYMFLDTVYHLNAVGREVRSRQLAAALAQFVPASHPPISK